MRHLRFSAMIGSIVLSIAVAFTVSLPAHAQGLPPHLIQTVTDRDIYEGMLELGFLVTPVLETPDCGLAYENVKNCVVRVQMGNAHGSGIIWEMTPEEIVIVTNKHVLDYWNEKNSYVHFLGEYDVDAQILGVSKQYDIGFLTVDSGQFNYMELQELRSARADLDVYAELEQGDLMFSIDSGSKTESAQYYEGTVEDTHLYIEDFEAYMLYGHGFAKAGMSGGGTFDGRGFLIGMTTGGTLQNETAGVPLPDIMEAYEEIMEETAFTD
ncbi:MAG: trypsin-like peptidase domain-containing protein [Lachnospiraceae bacterium]|nr:trypsin-like peptidase domain-containing protein [Lachnospiraceae bacterium]